MQCTHEAVFNIGKPDPFLTFMRGVYVFSEYFCFIVVTIYNVNNTASTQLELWRRKGARA
jgi:hypothetical protein